MENYSRKMCYNIAMEVNTIQEKITPILRAHGVKRAAVFGSVARQEDTPESDVDLLVTLGKPMGLIAYSRLIREMEESLGRKVDVVTDQSVNKFLKPYILTDLKTVYEA